MLKQVVRLPPIQTAACREEKAPGRAMQRWHRAVAAAIASKIQSKSDPESTGQDTAFHLLAFTFGFAEGL